VRVSAPLDHAQRSTPTERVDAPAAGQASPVATETTSSETYAGAATAVGGALGPDGTPTTGDGGDTQYEKEAATRTYAVGKVTEQVEAAPGAVQRLSVAVLLDSGASGAAGTAEVERLVSAAAGLDTGRGDLLAVSEMPFDRTPVEAPVTAAPADGSSPVDLVRPVGAVLLALVVLAAAWRSAHRATAVQRIPLPLPAGAGGGYPALDEIGPGVLDDDADGVDGTAELALPAPMALGPAEADERTVVKEQIADLIERQPDQVAQVLRGWLADRRS
ncbi:MAG: flagellar M-ring protein FliF C-terminal domain-containing protein, partial [Acidimicrobiia bacterium]